MHLVFRNSDYVRLYAEDEGPIRRKFPNQVIEEFFAACAEFVAADDERDIRALRSRRLEQVPRECEGCYSIRLNRQFRLIIVFALVDHQKTVEVVDIRDYH